MRLISLQSGSNGNCVYVEVGEEKLLFDAGISGKMAMSRLAGHGLDIRNITALLISHDHRDHIASMGIFQRKFNIPASVSARTLAAARQRCQLGQLGEMHEFTVGDAVMVGRVKIETIATPHDGVDGCGFVVDDGRKRLGILTDLGHVFDELGEVLATLDAVFLESNYDEAMLRDGPYPAFLKQRIAGTGGHISNVEAATLLASTHARSSRLQWACLGHLSAENNTPSLARSVVNAALGKRLPVHLATRYEASDMLTVE